MDTRTFDAICETTPFFGSSRPIQKPRPHVGVPPRLLPIKEPPKPLGYHPSQGLFLIPCAPPWSQREETCSNSVRTQVGRKDLELSHPEVSDPSCPDGSSSGDNTNGRLLSSVHNADQRRSPCLDNSDIQIVHRGNRSPKMASGRVDHPPADHQLEPPASHPPLFGCPPPSSFVRTGGRGLHEVSGGLLPVRHLVCGWSVAVFRFLLPQAWQAWSRVLPGSLGSFSLFPWLWFGLPADVVVVDRLGCMVLSISAVVLVVLNHHAALYCNSCRAVVIISALLQSKDAVSLLATGGVRLCIGAGFPSLVLKWIDAVADYIRLMDFLMPCWSLAMCSCSEYCRLDRDPFWSQWLFCKARGGCAQTAILLHMDGLVPVQLVMSPSDVTCRGTEAVRGAAECASRGLSVLTLKPGRRGRGLAWLLGSFSLFPWLWFGLPADVVVVDRLGCMVLSISAVVLVVLNHHAALYCNSCRAVVIISALLQSKGDGRSWSSHTADVLAQFKGFMKLGCSCGVGGTSYRGPLPLLSMLCLEEEAVASMKMLYIRFCVADFIAPLSAV
ncbi:hypothetical protein Nepgr_016459 [Nepenthes gracilis]|uniref:Uncharacterized protein n=1 Tax=Nepenthes gracilis TaxID=150966 RepID=A0AAD3SNL7_NEPGR|nr:hypothetical protein Nepgr_016459 [Nepenthes gracilis]